MHVLVLNPGSSTLKYRLINSAGDTVAGGLVERVEGAGTSAAAQQVLGRCQGKPIQAVGCRVVHGGPRFSAPTRVTPSVIQEIRDLASLAPLHNPVAADVLDATLALLPGIPVVAVFDTAFHRTIPDHAGLYAIPTDLAARLNLRRYGFHGTSHKFVSARLLDLTGMALPGSRLITCHLGNGASVCAVRDGNSVDTSMGLTPLEGLIMGTRCGDIDPGLVLHLLRTGNMSLAQVDDLLEHKSGLLGLGGHADMRDLERAVQSGDARAELALEAFCYRLRKYVAAYAAALEGVDAIAFTAGIGEHSGLVRAKTCAKLAWLGIQLDEGRNQQARGETRISRDGSPVQVWVVPTDEERQIARETVELIQMSGS